NWGFRRFWTIMAHVAVYLLAADNCFNPKPDTISPLHHHVRGLSHDSTAIFLSARAPRTARALCHAPSCLAEPRSRVLFDVETSPLRLCLVHRFGGSCKKPQDP